MRKRIIQAERRRQTEETTPPTKKNFKKQINSLIGDFYVPTKEGHHYLKKKLNQIII